jgi:hypothetical protein
MLLLCVPPIVAKTSQGRFERLKQRVAVLAQRKSQRLDESTFMRSSKSRSRGNKNRNTRPSGGNIINRVFDSSGPDGKVRGTPQQIIEKYNQLHRDAVLSGDRVDAENFAQHAEHYTRMLAEANREVEAKREELEEQNRQRQAERDRERQDRLAAQEAAANDPANMDQPRLDDEGSTLVETPEAAKQEAAPKPPRKPRQRKPRPPVEASEGTPDTPEAAE